MILQKENRILFQNTVFLKCAKKKKNDNFLFQKLWTQSSSISAYSIIEISMRKYCTLKCDLSSHVINDRLIDQVKSKGICLTIKDYILIQQKSFLPTHNSWWRMI